MRSGLLTDLWPQEAFFANYMLVIFEILMQTASMTAYGFMVAVWEDVGLPHLPQELVFVNYNPS